jgi:hypothetical protein
VLAFIHITKRHRKTRTLNYQRTTPGEVMSYNDNTRRDFLKTVLATAAGTLGLSMIAAGEKIKVGKLLRSFNPAKAAGGPASSRTGGSGQWQTCLQLRRTDRTA